MAKFKFDADATQESGNYSPAPEGEYVLRISECEYQRTSTDKHMLKLVLEIDEGPYKGRKVWTNVVFNPKGDAGHGLTVQALKAFGFEYDGSFELDTDDWNSDRTCRARLEIETYTDKKGVERQKNVIPTAGFITDSDAPPAPAASRKPAAQPTRKAAPPPADADIEEVPF